MEKRWSERRELQVGVEVYRQGSLLGACNSLDIGLGGTYLALDGSFDMHKDMDVQLVFSLQDNDHNTRHKVNARVARANSHGAGLKFCDFDTGVFRSLQEIMTHIPPSDDIPGIH